ncbi:unnamed protein product [Ilex paraguariensis]|uniref:RNase H type-1 domain-containing protein n=1 Tax=Ilex paraguariensis TaxID=185542 RepID=A0ABC8UEN8_9AQUA
MCLMEEECADHIFVDCVFAKSIWVRLAAMAGFQLVEKERPLVRMMRLCRLFRRQSDGCALIRSFAFLIFWQIWRERCRRRAGECFKNSYSIFLIICSLLRFKVFAIKQKVRDGAKERGILTALGISLPYVMKVRATWMAWEYPSAGTLKMNVDGAAKGNPGPSGGGMVVRNECGGVVLAASFFYGVCSNMAAEFKAMMDGLSMLVRGGLSVYHVWIESDSLVVVNTIKVLYQCSWPYLGILAQIR